MALIDSFILFLNRLGIGDRIQDGIVKVAEGLEPRAAVDLREAIQAILSNPEISPQQKLLYSELIEGKRFMGTIVQSALAGSIGSSLGGGITAPDTRLLEYRRDRVAESKRPPITDAILMLRRAGSRAPKVNEWIDDLGWSDEAKLLYSTILQTRIDDFALLTLFRRQLIDEGEFFEEMSNRGYLTDEIHKFIASNEVYAGVQDTIGFAVREAFDDDFAQRFQTDANRPSEFMERARQLGLNEDDAIRYWRAHWRLPGVNDAYEMFHRLNPNLPGDPPEVEFTESDLDFFLRAADFTPYWRERLKAISFNLPTRVDIRRFQSEGIISPQEAYKLHRQRGETHDQANWLVQLGQQMGGQSPQQMTASVILQGFEDGIYTKIQTQDLLLGVTKNPGLTSLLIAIREREVHEREIKAELKNIELLYLEGILDDTQLTIALNDLRLEPNRLTHEVNKLRVKKNRQVKFPAPSQLERWYKMNIIDANVFRDVMGKKGWVEPFISRYILEMSIEQQEVAEKEADRTQARLEKEQAKETRNEYQEQKATIQADINWIKLEIADLKIAHTNTEDSDRKEVIEDRIVSLQREIVRLQAVLSELRLEFQGG